MFNYKYMKKLCFLAIQPFLYRHCPGQVLFILRLVKIWFSWFWVGDIFTRKLGTFLVIWACGLASFSCKLSFNCIFHNMTRYNDIETISYFLFQVHSPLQQEEPSVAPLPTESAKIVWLFCGITGGDPQSKTWRRLAHVQAQTHPPWWPHAHQANHCCSVTPTCGGVAAWSPNTVWWQVPLGQTWCTGEYKVKYINPL